MSLYKKRKKRTYSEKEPFTVRYRQGIIFVLVLIIVGGIVAAVNAYELKRAVRLSAYTAAEEETVTYYYSGQADAAAQQSGTSEGTEQAAVNVNADDSADGAAGSADTADIANVQWDGTNTAYTIVAGIAGNTGYPDFSQDEITWEGKTYKRNTYIKPILAFGVDNSGSMHEKKEYGYAGQCDGIFLIAHDTARNTIKLLMIPRDTMTVVMEENPDTNVIQPYIDHLCLSYCFGDGMELSCENARYSVQTLLMNLPVSDYIAVDTSVIAAVNDLVGGVTVTIPTEGMEKADESFVYGSTVTLKGALAEKFIRYRDIGIDNSAINRMQQHRQYIAGFFRAVKETSRSDSNIVTRLYDEVQDYMVTNMPKESYLKTAADVLSQGDISDENMLAVPGYGTATETYDEYYANKNGIVSVILSMFFREV